MRLILAFVAAVLAPTGALTLWYLYGQFATFDAGDPYIWVRTRGFAILCLAVSMVCVFALGMPAYLALRGRPALRWRGAWLAGFLLAAIPYALLTFSGVTANPGEFMAGWLQYLGSVALVGACGTLAAASFWVVSGMGSKMSP